jgi:hypothetical protein
LEGGAFYENTEKTSRAIFARSRTMFRELAESCSCAANDYSCAPWASCLDSYFPCSTGIIGNILLMAIYGYLLATGT